jgi:FtsH-binding integral membrane protein
MLSEDYQDYPPDQKPLADLRLGFIRKVYGILSAQLLLTTLFVAVGTLSTAFQEFVQENPWVILLAFLGNLITLIALVCCSSVANTVPTNYIFLGIFTFCEAFVVACVCGFYDPVSVLIAALMTLAVTIALTVYAMTTKSDFTVLTGIMIVFLVGATLFALFMPFFFHSRMLQVIISVVFIIIYGIYLVIDTQLVIGSGKYRFDEEDYIIAALNIYIDIVGLFLYLLELFGDKN